MTDQHHEADLAVPAAPGDLAAQDRRASGSLAAAYRRGYEDSARVDADPGDVIVVPDDLAVPAAPGDLAALERQWRRRADDTMLDPDQARAFDMAADELMEVIGPPAAPEVAPQGGEGPWLPMPVERAIERLDRSTAADTIGEHRHAVITLQNFARQTLAAPAAPRCATRPSSTTPIPDPTGEH